MTLADSYVALARYNRWMNEKLYALAATLTDEQRKRDQRAFFKSIHGTLDHLLFGDLIWLSRFGVAEILPPPAGAEMLYEDFDALRSERVKTDAALDRWARSLTDDVLATPLRYMRAGQPYEHPLWLAVSHLFNHQTHHRGQVTTLLMQQGHDPGVTDLMAMLRLPDWKTT